MIIESYYMLWYIQDKPVPRRFEGFIWMPFHGQNMIQICRASLFCTKDLILKNSTHPLKVVIKMNPFKQIIMRITIYDLLIWGQVNLISPIFTSMNLSSCKLSDQLSYKMYIFLLGRGHNMFYCLLLSWLLIVIMYSHLIVATDTVT